MILDLLFPRPLYGYASDTAKRIGDDNESLNKRRTEYAKTFRKKKSRRKMADQAKRRNRK